MSEVEDAMDWFWGVLKGDFEDEQTTGQIIVGTAISMIPVLDQIADIRDLIANLLHIRKDPDDTWRWVALVITLIGLVPVLGSLLKGIFKIVFRFVKTGGTEAGKAIEAILALLRGAGKGDPVRFLKELPYDAYLKDVLKHFDDILNGLRKGIDKSIDYMSSRWLNWALGSTARRLRLVEQELQRLQRVGHEKIPDAMKALKVQVDKLLAHAKPADVKGDTNKVNTLAHSSKPLMRLEYEVAVKRIGDDIAAMRKAGKSEEEVARWANEQRRAIGKKFKDATDPDLREIIYRRNTKKFGDPLGPTYEDLKRGYRIADDGEIISISKTGPKTDRQIADSAASAGGDDFPWDKILEYSSAKRTGDENAMRRLLQEIDEIVNKGK
ncbi:hypothetical protein [Herbaspirillum huttiense]|uniref:hypothetical protein n=1 Tax=Herbaspirillum huttiense TaxID=863372 RepID=UPI0039B02134